MKNGEAVVKNDFTLSAVSDTGVVSVRSPKGARPSASGKKREVGLFYFIWIGADSKQDTNYNNAEILKRLPDPRTHEGRFTLEEWTKAGGGAKRGDFHFWDEPMFGFYNSGDEWVIERHIRMFVEAGVDYLVLDFTNGVFPDYIENLEVLFKCADKYYKQGFNVPKIALMAFDDGPRTVNTVYERFYSKHPEYSHLFYHWNGHEKPVIFDNIASYSKHANFQINTEEKLASYMEGVTDFFEIRDMAFPHETKVPYHNFPSESESFLYLDFRPEPKKVTDKEGMSYINISLSEIEATNAASSQWYKDTADRTRSWDGKCNRNWLTGEEDAAKYGYNFARQFEIALKEDPDNIFITGWNEWVAQLQVHDNGTINLIDNADMNNSRDIEPMKGGYSDNYYLQLCHYIARFKGLDSAAENGYRKEIDINGDLSDWQDGEIPAFTGFSDSIRDRDSFEAYKTQAKLTDSTGRNDLILAKACEDENNYYFYVAASDDITDYDKENGMTLFISTDSQAGYNFAVNRTSLLRDGVAVEKNENGAWKQVGTAEYRVSGNEMAVALPKALLNAKVSSQIAFKWADNFTEDPASFYTRGSSLPYGRFNLVYKAI